MAGFARTFIVEFGVPLETCRKVARADVGVQ
jgi:hypothetical protein